MDLAGGSTTVEDLIVLAEGTDSAVRDGVHAHGADRTAEVLLTEVVDRARLLPSPQEEVPVQFDLGFAGQRLGFSLTAGPGSVKLAGGWLPDPSVIIRQDLPELLREVYGPAGRRHATREVHVAARPPMPGLAADDPVAQRFANAQLATRQVIAALTRPLDDLTELAVRFGSDKWGHHWYTPNYQRYLAPYREDRVKILELGVGGYDRPDVGGASLRMWKHYFRRGLVYGLDISDKSGIAEPRLRTIQGDQSDAASLAELGGDLGPFDVVVDDGSHLNPHVITSFHALFQHVRPGGLYVIEDVQTSYWPGWGGNSTDLNDPATTMGLVKQLIDGLNHQDLVRDGEYEPTYTDRTVTGVFAHHNMVVIEKGLNTEQPAPASIPR